MGYEYLIKYKYLGVQMNVKLNLKDYIEQVKDKERKIKPLQLKLGMLSL